MIYENLTEFFGFPVEDFVTAEDWRGSEIAYRVRIDWDSQETIAELLGRLAGMPGSKELRAIVIGNWAGDDSSRTSESIVSTMVERVVEFAGLRAIFFGDITSEENEISWITQSDLSPLFNAYPQLEVVRVRGGNQLVIGPIDTAALKHLGIETGGLDRSVLNQLVLSTLPALQHLELWLGTEGYGGTSTVEDLQPILSGDIFPALKYLGIRNTDLIDDFLPALVNSPILNRITTLDLSLGNMTDVGARCLMELRQNASLKKLDLSHHYLTEEMCSQLKSLPFEVVADDPRGAETEWRSIYASE